MHFMKATDHPEQRRLPSIQDAACHVTSRPAHKNDDLSQQALSTVVLSFPDKEKQKFQETLQAYQTKHRGLPVINCHIKPWSSKAPYRFKNKFPKSRPGDEELLKEDGFPLSLPHIESSPLSGRTPRLSRGNLITRAGDILEGRAIVSLLEERLARLTGVDSDDELEIGINGVAIETKVSEANMSDRLGSGGTTADSGSNSSPRSSNSNSPGSEKTLPVARVEVIVSSASTAKPADDNADLLPSISEGDSTDQLTEEHCNKEGSFSSDGVSLGEYQNSDLSPAGECVPRTQGTSSHDTPRNRKRAYSLKDMMATLRRSRPKVRSPNMEEDKIWFEKIMDDSDIVDESCYESYARKESLAKPELEYHTYNYVRRKFANNPQAAKAAAEFNLSRPSKGRCVPVFGQATTESLPGTLRREAPLKPKPRQGRMPESNNKVACSVNEGAGFAEL